jgi:nucleoside phosphorylase
MTAPVSRDEFEIAIVCALAVEYNAVSLVIDQFWDEGGDRYKKAVGDPNTYTTGRIGAFDVVVALLPSMGKASAAGAAASLRSSYPELKLALLAGICGGVPKAATDNEVLLGDVVISKTVVQYDLGRQFPDDFATKDTLGRPTKNIRNLVAFLETELARERLEQRTAFFLEQLQRTAIQKRRRANYRYPGADNDILFEATYRHKHQVSAQCRDAVCQEGSDAVCQQSRQLSCDELRCDGNYVVRRERLETNRQLEGDGRSKEAQAPSIFIGRVGSGDTVVKSGEHRDRNAERHGVVAFEMEGAGVWDEVPCIVIKGVCDYADSHKNKRWQDFAAATAASAAKALLERYTQTDKPPRSRLTEQAGIEASTESSFHAHVTAPNTRAPSTPSHNSSLKTYRAIPFTRNGDIILRPDLFAELDRLLPLIPDHSAALWGLGGSG